jgi:hypothetical protein
VGGNFPGLPNSDTAFPAQLKVDFVRVYERDGGEGNTPPPRGPGRVKYKRA